MSPKVCISTPSTGSMKVLTADWRLRAFSQLAPDVVVQTVVTPMPLEHARNEQVHRFFLTDCSHLFLLDSDCQPQEQTIQKLLAYDFPIISAPHPALVNGELGLMVVDRAAGGKGYVQHRPLKGLQGPGVLVGGAGLLIRRDVLESLQPPWFHFEYDTKGRLTLGEDFYFCEKALAAGYEIWAQCDLHQQHDARVLLRWPTA